MTLSPIISSLFKIRAFVNNSKNTQFIPGLLKFTDPALVCLKKKNSRQGFRLYLSHPNGFRSNYKFINSEEMQRQLNDALQVIFSSLTKR